jgi:hypothetical protein
MEFKELLEALQIEGILDKFYPTDASVWESICREYSKQFHTPLHLVLEMPPTFILRHYYANQLDDIKLDDKAEHLLEIIRAIEDPNYEKTKEEEITEFLDDAEREEEERVKSGISLSQHLSKKKKNKKPAKPEEPKKGFIDLSYLEREEMLGDGEEP